MKYLILLFSFLTIQFTTAFSQNFLPLVWKISFSDTAIVKQAPRNLEKWKEVNLLLSWERQGFFGRQGKCCLASDFIVPEQSNDSLFVLTVGLQCDISNIYINSTFIGGNLSNQFWSKRDAQIEFKLPKGLILKNKTNRIEIFASGLSYTGGISHNICTLGVMKPQSESYVKMIIPTHDHVITNKIESIKIKFRSPQKGEMKLSINNDFHQHIVDKTFIVNPQDSLLMIDLSKELSTPGFYECAVILENGSFTGDVQWVAVSPEKLACKTDTVNGFKNYWNKTLSELHTIDPAFKVMKVDSLCSQYRNGYVIEMKSSGNLTIRGYYFVPKKEGKYAALLHVPGYGWGFQNVDNFLKSKENVIELALCVRGHGISNDVFNPGFDIPGIWGYMICSENENAYRSIYMDCVRAVEFLQSRTEVDAKRIGVLGGSQGGGLTLATAALCNDKIAACAYFDPFQCDIHDFINIRQLCQDELRSYMEYYKNTCSMKQILYVQDLINTKGFANWITCPTYFATALFDDDCPPHVGFAAYNLIKTTKQYKVYPNDSHLGESSYYDGFMEFLKKQLKF